MKFQKSFLLLAAVALLLGGHTAYAQDSVKVEPIDPTIDVSKLTYNILVDGNLAQDDPANNKYKTLQAAYAAAPEGTADKPIVIGIKPNVYQLPGGPPRTPSMSITKNYITFLGLTNNRRTVVLADNRGLQQGADDDGYILDVRATGFTLKNLTVVNYCNNDYEYPGDPSKNLKKRSDVITQGVALQAAGDKHVYENVALLGRLDTMFLQTTRSYFKNVYIEGTDDFIGGGQVSVWEDCEITFPIGHGVMSATGITFINCKFEATQGLQFYKVEFRSAAHPDALINCTLPVNSRQAPVAWLRGVPDAQPSQFTVTYHNKDASGKPAVVYDSNMGAPTFTYSRELSDQEALAYNPWNILRANPTNGTVDGWDPAGVKAKYAGQENLVYSMTLANAQNRATGPGNGNDATFNRTQAPSVSASIRTGGPGAFFVARITPASATDPTIKWSTDSNLISLSAGTGSSVTVTGQNQTNHAQWVPIKASASNGFYVTAYVYCEPKYIDAPAFLSKPKINPPANGHASVSYTLDLGGRQDQSLITWYICDDLKGTNGRTVAVSRGNQPMTTLPLTTGYIGKYLLVGVEPKHEISDPGPAVTAITPTPVKASDVPSPNISVNFRNFPIAGYDSYVSGLWTLTGTWTSLADDSFINGYGLRPGTAAYLLYQQDVDTGDMQVDLAMSPEKTEGTGFSIPGSPDETGPRNLHSDIYIKYNPRTKNGYALRFWRTTLSAAKCMYQLYKIVDGVGSPLDSQQVLTGVLKPMTHLTIKAIGTTLSVTAKNNVDGETLSLQGTITSNHFGGAGVFWPGGSSNIYSQFDISYPGAKPTN